MENAAFVAHGFACGGFMFSRAELAEILDRPRESELCIQETWYENCSGAKKRESLEKMEQTG